MEKIHGFTMLKSEIFSLPDYNCRSRDFTGSTCRSGRVVDFNHR